MYLRMLFYTDPIASGGRSRVDRVLTGWWVIYAIQICPFPARTSPWPYRVNCASAWCWADSVKLDPVDCTRNIMLIDKNITVHSANLIEYGGARHH